MRYPKGREVALHRGGRLTLKHCINDLQNALRACRLNGMDTKEHIKKSTHHATTSSYKFSEPKNKKLTKLNTKLGSRVLQLRPRRDFEEGKATAPNPNTVSTHDRRMLHSSGEYDSLLHSHSRKESLIHPMPKPISTLETRGHAPNKSQSNFSGNAQTHSYGAEHPNIVGVRDNEEEKRQNCRESRLVDIVNLNYFHEHPMLQKELVAEIDGRNIRFQLVEVDPEILLQERPIIMSEPLPSLIWPYD
ncbi:(ZYRO0A04290g) [Zygosaccharomyces parabailii]|nr:(ZYRO0A04290g) [Zygosaccharomyces parabailii]CDH16176.1 uncharacterized protein ZBAI_07964 [Zygosaccharomyces bailii ISA1307]